MNANIGNEDGIVETNDSSLRNKQTSVKDMSRCLGVADDQKKAYNA